MVDAEWILLNRITAADQRTTVNIFATGIFDMVRIESSRSRYEDTEFS